MLRGRLQPRWCEPLKVALPRTILPQPVPTILTPSRSRHLWDGVHSVAVGFVPSGSASGKDPGPSRSWFSCATSLEKPELFSFAMSSQSSCKRCLISRSITAIFSFVRSSLRTDCIVAKSLAQTLHVFAEGVLKLCAYSAQLFIVCGRDDLSAEFSDPIFQPPVHPMKLS